MTSATARPGCIAIGAFEVVFFFDLSEVRSQLYRRRFLEMHLLRGCFTAFLKVYKIIIRSFQMFVVNVFKTFAQMLCKIKRNLAKFHGRNRKGIYIFHFVKSCSDFQNFSYLYFMLEVERF